MADADNTETPEKIDKMLSERFKLIEELLATEFTYVNDLKTLKTVFYNPLIGSTEILPKDEFTNIFSSVLVNILDFNETLYKELRRTLGTKSADGQKVGESFLPLVSFLKMYSIYCQNRPNSLDAQDRCKKKYPKFEKFLDESLTQTDGQSLDSFLIKPVQRICRYPLLFSGLLKNTPKSSSDYPVLQQTLDRLQKIAEEVNEYTRKKDNANKLFELSQKLEDFDEQINIPDRMCLFDRDISIKVGSASKQPLWIGVFNDMVLIAKKKKNKMTFKNKLLYQNLTLTIKEATGEEDENFPVEIVDSASSTTFLLFETTRVEQSNWRKKFDSLQANLPKPKDSIAAASDEGVNSSGALLRVPSSGVKKQRTKSIGKDSTNLIITSGQASENTSPSPSPSPKRARPTSEKRKRGQLEQGQSQDDDYDSESDTHSDDKKRKQSESEDKPKKHEKANSLLDSPVTKRMAKTPDRHRPISVHTETIAAAPISAPAPAKPEPSAPAAESTLDKRARMKRAMSAGSLDRSKLAPLGSRGPKLELGSPSPARLAAKKKADNPQAAEKEMENEKEEKQLEEKQPLRTEENKLRVEERRSSHSRQRSNDKTPEHRRQQSDDSHGSKEDKKSKDSSDKKHTRERSGTADKRETDEEKAKKPSDKLTDTKKERRGSKTFERPSDVDLLREHIRLLQEENKSLKEKLADTTKQLQEAQKQSGGQSTADSTKDALKSIEENLAKLKASLQL